MNRIWTILTTLTLGGLWTFMVLPGCRTVAVPTFPSTYTPVPSATSTFTRTNTLTFTVTSTSTFSPTVGSPTSTPTLTNTVTQTPTATVTNTPGAATSTPTFTPCNASSVLTTFNFDGTFDCWHLDSSSSSVVTTVDVDTTVKHSGTGSMRAAVVEPGASTNVQLELQYVPPSNLTGVTITAWVYVDSSLSGTALQIFTQSGSGWTWNSGGWTTPTGGTWTQVSWTPPFSNGGEDPTQVQLIGIQFYSVPTSSSGNIYIDDVTLTGIVGAPTSTPTPSPTATNSPTPGGTTATPTCSTTTTPTNKHDVEDNNNQLIVQQCRSGYWFSSNDGAVGALQTTGGVGLPLPPIATATAQPVPTSEPWTDATTGAGANPGCSASGSSYAVEVATNDGYSSYQNFGFNLTQPKAAYDATAYTGIQFCAKNSLGSLVVSFQVADNDPAVQSYGSGPHTMPVTLGTSWANFQVPLTAFSAPTSASCVSYPRANGCNSYGTPTVFQPNALMTLQWAPPNNTFSDVWIDNLSFY